MTIRVLHVDDDPEMLEIAREALERQADYLDVTSLESAGKGLERLGSEEFDCVLSDYQMPGKDGLEFLDAVRTDHHDLPFVLFTGKGSEEIASQAIGAGVSGYFQKETGIDQFTVLANRIATLVAKHQAEQRARLAVDALDASRDGIALFVDGKFRYLNDAYASFYGYDVEELLGKGWNDLYPESELRHYEREVMPTLERDGAWTGDCTCLHRDGSRFQSRHSLSKVEGDGHVCVIHNGSVER